MELSSSCCTDINIHIDVRLVSQGISGVIYSQATGKPLVLYDVQHGIPMEPMKGKWASSRGDTELFCISEVTAVFLLSSYSGLRDSLAFHQAH